MNEAARDAFNHELLCFLGASPTPFHAVGALASLLEEGGFRELREQDAWACTRRKAARPWRCAWPVRTPTAPASG